MNDLPSHAPKLEDMANIAIGDHFLTIVFPVEILYISLFYVMLDQISCSFSIIWTVHPLFECVSMSLSTAENFLLLLDKYRKGYQVVKVYLFLVRCCSLQYGFQKNVRSSSSNYWTNGTEVNTWVKNNARVWYIPIVQNITDSAFLNY